MKTNKKINILLISVFTTFIFGCGGGGSDDSRDDSMMDDTIDGGQIVFSQAAVSDQQVFMDSNGNGVAIWSADNSDGNSSIWSSTYDSLTELWSTAVEIANYNRNIVDFNAAANDQGEVHVVWTQFDANLTFGAFQDGTFEDQIWGAHYRSDTGWSDAALIHDPDPVTAETYPVPFVTPIIAVNNNGGAFLAWKQVNDSRSIDSTTSLHTLRFNPSAGWVDDRYITQLEDGLFDGIALSTNDNDHAMLVWVQSTDTNNYLYARRYTQTRGWDLLEPAHVVEPDASDEINNYDYLTVQLLPNDNALVFWRYRTRSTGVSVSAGRENYASTNTWAPTFMFEPNLAAEPTHQLAISRNGDGLYIYGEIKAELGGRILSSKEFVFSDNFSSDTTTITQRNEVISIFSSAVDLDDSGYGIAIWGADEPGNPNTLKSRLYHPITGWDEDAAVKNIVTNVIPSRLVVDMIPDGNGDAMILYFKGEPSGEVLRAKKIDY